jgi:hypothetical protein
MTGIEWSGTDMERAFSMARWGPQCETMKHINEVF